MNPLLDPGLDHVIFGETSISSLDQGLIYRGYAIEDLGQHAAFEEVAHLLLHGELPTIAELAEFRARIATAATLPPPLTDTLRQLPPQTNLMDVMRTGASLLAHWDAETGSNERAACVRKAERILAQMPVVLGTRFRLEQGQSPMAWDKNSTFAANVFRLLTGESPTPLQERAMNATLVMYAEHDFNASTFTARVVVSTWSDIHAAITAAIGTLKGPLHGGANERVAEVLQAAGSATQAEAWLRGVLSRKEKVMGFGHRVYKQEDPRATYLKTICRELAAAHGSDDLEQTAEVIERIMTTDKKIPPNLDWPVGRIYHYLGLPKDVYTPLFVVSRVSGWSAHVIEQLGQNRLVRPRSSYIGSPPRPFVSLAQRGREANS